MRMVRHQREGGIAVRTDSKGRSSPELLVTGCDLRIDGIGTAGADEGRLLHARVGGKRSADGPVSDEGRQDAILASPDCGTGRGIESREDIGLADPQAVAARVGGLADICLQIRAVHHNGGVVLAHMRGKASRDFIADMAVCLRARHADDVLTPIRARGRISSGRKASCDLRAVL